ncbi:MAG: hypothetical protein QXS93_04435 [Candidatus Micrarchaeia archaeon]
MIYVVFALIAGFLTKVADSYSERKRKSILISAPLGVIYGCAIGISSLLNNTLLPLIGGVVLGNTLALKIDKIEHYIGVMVILAFAVYAGMLGATVNPAILFAFVIAAFADEKLHDLSNKAVGNRKAILQARLVTPITALAFAVLDVSYLLYIVAFDLGYRVAGHITDRAGRNPTQ